MKERIKILSYPDGKTKYIAQVKKYSLMESIILTIMLFLIVGDNIKQWQSLGYIDTSPDITTKNDEGSEFNSLEDAKRFLNLYLIQEELKVKTKPSRPAPKPKPTSNKPIVSYKQL